LRIVRNGHHGKIKEKIMSMYNLIHGENKMASLLLGLLGLFRDDIPRYRDCFWNGERIGIYTRVGGGNRDDYEEGIAFLRAQPTYISDVDDDFDNTYATFYFRMPDRYAWVIPQLTAADATPEQKWHTFLAKLEDIHGAGKDDPQVQRVMQAMKPFLDVLVGQLEKVKEDSTGKEKEKS
jgi:hypothetical protein